MKDLVELIAKALVDNPDKVKVSQLDGEQSSIIELKVAKKRSGYQNYCHCCWNEVEKEI